MNMKKIFDFEEIKIYSGQIMGRITVDKNNEEKAVAEFREIVPKAITANGTIDASELLVEQVITIPDYNKITELGDIVIKLSTPYDSAIITDEFVGCIVPSFCAIIRNKSEIETEYLQAFLSSKLCKDQLRKKVAENNITMLSIAKLKDVNIPIPAQHERISIGKKYLSVQKKLEIVKKIVELESKRNDILFTNLLKENGNCNK